MIKAILTGQSRGLGAAIASELLSRNIPVLGISRSSNPGLGQGHAAALEQVELDLGDADALASWLSGSALNDFVSGCETVLLINNAGTVQPVSSIDKLDPAAIARSIALNVAAPLMLASAVAAGRNDTQERRILHVSSGAGRNAYPSWSVYCATKAALDHHARAVQLEQRPGVRICSLAPGVIDTDMQAEIRATTLEQFPLRERFETLKRDGALSRPEDCAKLLVDFVLNENFGKDAVADLRG